MTRSVARQSQIRSSDWNFLDRSEAALASASDAAGVCAEAAQMAVSYLCDSCSIEGFPDAPVAVRGRVWHDDRHRSAFLAGEPDDGVAFSESLVVSGQHVGKVTLSRLDGGWSQPTRAVARLFADTIAHNLARFLEPSGGAINAVPVSVLVHELRNAVAPLHYDLEILRLRGTSIATDHSNLDRLARHVHGLGELLDGMFELCRAEQGKIVLRKQLLDLETVVRCATETVEPLVRERDHSLTICIQPEARLIWADAQRLEQVLTNLLTNAVKYTGPGGEIELSAERQDEAVLIRVRDSGKGIAPDLLPRVFDRFVQSEPDRGGLGVGLALVRWLVELHGGRVWASSDGPGQGSEFGVRLRAAASSSWNASAFLPTNATKRLAPCIN